ncbi:MAG: signal peptide peptidase SppA [Treponema sp.]|nr:signal peptide peptidase SppA [Treponema sp.]
MKKDFRTGLIVLIVLILIICGVTVASLYLPEKTNITSSSIYKVDYTKNYKGQYVGIVNLTGTIEEKNNEYSQDWILNTITKLKNDKKNIGMVLYINSPGGSVYQADQVYFALKEYKAAGKALDVYMGPLAASGGYYIACAADEIWANRNTLTGSIGVIAGQSFDMTEFLDNLGIKSETIHAGKNKNMLNYNETLTDEQRQIMQSIADECYEQFCKIVAEERGLTIGKVHELADGRIYSANQAFTNGLIDNIGSFDKAIDNFTAKLEKPGIKVTSYSYEAKKNFVSTLIEKVNFSNSNAKGLLPEKVLEDIDNSDLYPAYLYK